MRAVRVCNLHQGTPLPLCRAAWLSLGGVLRHSSPESFAFFMFELHCHCLFFLPGNEAKPGRLINPSQCWAAVIG